MSRAPELPRLVNFSDSDMSTDSDEESREGSSACNVMPGYVSANVTPRVDKNPAMNNLQHDKSNKLLTHSSAGGSNDSKNYGNQRTDINESSKSFNSSYNSKNTEKEESGDRRINHKRNSSRGRRSRSGGERRSLSRSGSGSQSSRSRSGSADRSHSKDRSRSRSRGRRSRSWNRKRSGSRGRRSGSRNRRSGSRSKDRRSRSGSRGRYRRRSRSRSHGKYRRKYDDRRRRSPYRRRSPPRAHKTLDTLEKLGIELKPPPPPNQEPEPYIPPYYNRLAVNPSKYAQQIAKRKLIWGHKNAEETKSTSWQGATFSQDQDGKMTAKFKRLMGIKQEEQASTSNDGQDLIKRQQELFSSMELQYEAARQATHTQRGVGLGFSSHPHNFPPT